MAVEPGDRLRPEDRFDEVARWAERHLVVAGEDLMDQVRVGDPDRPPKAQDVDRDRAVYGVALLAALEEREGIPDVPERLCEDSLPWAGGKVLRANGRPRRSALDVCLGPGGRLRLHRGERTPWASNMCPIPGS